MGPEQCVAVVVVGAGQSGLATAYHLRRVGLRPGRDLVVLDAGERPGGAWPRTWSGLRLFSPAAHSSLPGWPMPPWDDARHGFPPREHVVDYLTRYEQRYDLDVRRPVLVRGVHAAVGGLRVGTDAGTWRSRHVVSATGSWSRPFWPRYPGQERFGGRQLHAADLGCLAETTGARVAVVGGGNSAAQVLAALSEVTDTLWCTLRAPRLLPDDVDGRVLFAAATSRIQARARGEEHAGHGLGDVVATPQVRAARDRGDLVPRPMFEQMTATGLRWADGTHEEVDTVVWCTGFRPALGHLAPLDVRGPGGRVSTEPDQPTRSVREPRLHLVGYGEWTGPASATLVGVGRSARVVAATIAADLAADPV